MNEFPLKYDNYFMLKFVTTYDLQPCNKYIYSNNKQTTLDFKDL